MTYISRDYVLKCMEDSYKNAGISAEAKAKMTRWLNKAPTADVRPVVRARWEEFGEAKQRFYSCSNCFVTHYRWDNYCPNCGADMREENNG